MNTERLNDICDQLKAKGYEENSFQAFSLDKEDYDETVSAMSSLNAKKESIETDIGVEECFVYGGFKFVLCPQK